MQIVAVTSHGSWLMAKQPPATFMLFSCPNNQAVVTQIRHTLLGMEINNWYNNNYLHTILAPW